MRRVGRNIVSLLAADILRRLIGFTAVAYLARILGTNGFGVVTIGWTVLSYGLVVSAAGLPTLGVKRTASGEGMADLPGIIGARLVVSVAVYALILFVAAVFVQDRTTAALMAVMSLAVFAQAVWPDWYFQGMESVAPLATSRVVSSAVYLIVVVVMVHSPHDVLWVAAGAVIGDVFAADYLVRNLRARGVSFRVRVEPSLVGSLLMQSIPLAIGGILAGVSINYPPIALGLLRSNADVGIYGAASKLVFFLLVGDRIMSTLLLPASSRLHAQSPEDLKDGLEYALRWILMISLPVAAGGMVLAGPLVSIVFGPAYTDAIPVFQVFIWYFFFTMLHTVYTSGLIASGGSKIYGEVMMATAGFYAALVTGGVFVFGAVGGAFGAVLSEAISLVLMSRAFQASVKLSTPRGVPGQLGAAAVMAAVVWLLSGKFLLLPLAAGVLVYPACLLLFRAATVDDVKNFIGRF